MEPTKLLHASYLDILFDQRNKNYGSYELRKHYNQRVGKAALMLLFCVSALAGLSFITLHKAEELRVNTRDIAPKLFDITPPKVLPELPVVPPPAQLPQHIKTTPFTEPVITENDLVKPGKELPENRTLIDSQPGTTSAHGDSTGIAMPALPGSGREFNNNHTVSNKPVVWVPQMPQFDGDRDAYMSSHLHYPDAAHAAGIEGRVIVQFVVNEDGSVSDAKVMQGIGGGCDEEALRMVNGMPKWKPGKQNGTAVKVFFSLPINFVLN